MSSRCDTRSASFGFPPHSYHLFFSHFFLLYTGEVKDHSLITPPFISLSVSFFFFVVLPKFVAGHSFLFFTPLSNLFHHCPSRSHVGESSAFPRACAGHHPHLYTTQPLAE
jgi:hypothetical protein